METPTEEGQALLLLFLPLPRLVILEPVKHVLPFNVPVRLQPGSDLLYLLRRRRPYPLLVPVLQHGYLFLGRVPPRTRRNPPAGVRRLVMTLHSFSLSLFAWFLLVEYINL